LYDTHDGSSAVRKVWDTIYGNFIFANYHSSMAVDNDDGRYLKFAATLANAFSSVCMRIHMRMQWLL
jgi:hypothetical protein